MFAYTLRRIALIPLYDELRKFLATCPRTATTVLTTSRGTSWEGWGTGWNETMRISGLAERGLRFHDLRGTAATKFFAANIPEREIALMLGWSEKNVERIIRKYVNGAVIIRERIAKMNAALKDAG